MKLILAVALIFSVVWIARLYDDNKTNLKKLKRAETELSFLKKSNEQDRDQRQRTVQDLDSQIQHKKKEITDLTEQLKGINDVELGGNNPSTLQWDISHQKEIISDLERQLRDLKTQEGQIGAQNQIVQTNEKWSKAQSEKALQDQIGNQEQSVRDAESRLNDAKTNKSTKDVIGQLQNQLKSQKEFLKSLKSQKLDLNAKWNRQIGVDGAQAQVLKAENKRGQNFIQDRLVKEKAKLAELQKSLQTDTQVAKTHNAHLSQIQTDLKTKRSELEALQKSKQEQVAKIKGS
jgi:hypothetical protein